MGARIEYFSEKFEKSYYLHWGADNETWNKLSRAGIVDIDKQNVFEETLREEMSSVHNYDEYESELFRSGEMLFKFMKTHNGFIKRSELIEFDEGLEELCNKLIFGSMVMVGKEHNVFHLGPCYPGSHDSFIGDVIGYIGKIEDIELLDEFKVAIKGEVVESRRKPDYD